MISNGPKIDYIKWEVSPKTGMKSNGVGPKTVIISNEGWHQNRYDIKWEVGPKAGVI